MIAENINHLERLRIPLQLFGLRFRIFADPDSARRILLTNQQAYGRCALVFDRIRPLTGINGLVQLSGPSWGKLRQSYAPIFSPDNLASLTPMFQARTHALLDLNAQLHPCSDAGETDILPLITHYVLDNALRLFAGAGYQDARELPHYFLELNRLCGSIMLSPFSLNPFTRRRIRTLERKLDDAIEGFLPGTPLANRFTEGDPSLLRDQVKTFLFAGHETTTSSIASAVWLLAKHPSYQAKFHRLSPGERSAFLRSVYAEALRLYPPAWMLVRTATRDDAELRVRAGEHVIIKVRDIHRDPAFWDEPNVFLPERHESPYKHPMQFIPYGAGPKKCLGAPLAPVEAAAFMQPLLERFHLSAVSELKMRPHITLFPEGPVKVRLEARQ